MNRTDRIFYVIGWVLYSLLALTGILQTLDIFALTDIGMPCSFRQVTGLYCPGCGGTHALMALASGHLIESFCCHPLVPYTAACFAIFLLWNSIALMVQKIKVRSKSPHLLEKVPFVHFHIVFVYIGIGIIFLQWIVKNILLLNGCFTL